MLKDSIEKNLFLGTIFLETILNDNFKIYRPS